MSNVLSSSFLILPSQLLLVLIPLLGPAACPGMRTKALQQAHSRTSLGCCCVVPCVCLCPKRFIDVSQLSSSVQNTQKHWNPRSHWNGLHNKISPRNCYWQVLLQLAAVSSVWFAVGPNDVQKRDAGHHWTPGNGQHRTPRLFGSCWHPNFKVNNSWIIATYSLDNSWICMWEINGFCGGHNTLLLLRSCSIFTVNLHPRSTIGWRGRRRGHCLRNSTQKSIHQWHPSFQGTLLPCITHETVFWNYTSLHTSFTLATSYSQVLTLESWDGQASQAYGDKVHHIIHLMYIVQFGIVGCQNPKVTLW